jgi:signal transduction histidine kinase/ligand-binding sensor domain-containing protein
MLVMGSLAGAHAGAALPAPPPCFTRSWQVGDNGLPENNVTAVVQTRDGYIWLGTRSGLARFDGVRFKVFNANNTPEMHSSHVTCLFEAKDGTLWIGHDTGEVTAYQAGKFRPVPITAAWHGGKLFAIFADTTGDIWLLNQSAELARLRDNVVIPWPSNHNVHLLALSHSPQGGVWIQRDNDIALLRNGRLTSLFDGPSDTRYVQGMCASRDGGLWVFMESLIRKWKEGAWAEINEPLPWEWTPSPNAIETRDGYLAVATADHGLYLMSPGGESLQFCRTNGFSSDWVNGVCEDREGNVWAGTGNGGLEMLKLVNVKTVTPPDQWQGRSLMCVNTDARGAMWVGTEGAGLYRYQEGDWTNYGESNGLNHHYIWTVAPNAEGGTWAGSWGAGVFVLNGGVFNQPKTLEDFYVGALLPARAGGMWVGTSEGLLRHEAGQTHWLARQPEIFSPDVRAICEGADGAVWFGMSGGGLGCWQEGQLRQFRHTNGLSSDFVQCLRLDKDGTLWIGTFGGGLNRLRNGHFTAIGLSQGLPSDVICDIQDDGCGFFWMSSHNGIIRASKAELESCANQTNGSLNCLTYGLSDGLPSLECSGGFQPAGCRNGDGWLWFPTAKGLVGIDPGNVRTNPLPPPVVIEEVRVDEVPVANHADDSDELRIAPGRHQLEFDYSGLSYVAPEKVRFKYRVDGLDKEWLDAGTKRLANYSYMPPGNYAFRVIACNNDGIWNERGAKLVFVVLPFFWQTWWFAVLIWAGAAVLAGLAVLMATRRRMQIKLEGMERQQAVERERTRIAKDIHDDLGASLTRISMLSQSARGIMDDLPGITRCLEQIFLTARESTRAMADIVWAVNPSHDTLDSLATYLQKFAQNFLQDANIRCRINMPLELPPWPLTADIRHNLFLAFKEAINNVVRHAAATEVRISLKVQPQGFVLTIEDNGCGFRVPKRSSAGPPESGWPQGNGLKNMHRRLVDLGGRFEVSSSVGAGTKVTFSVPVSFPAE